MNKKFRKNTLKKTMFSKLLFSKVARPTPHETSQCLKLVCNRYSTAPRKQAMFEPDGSKQKEAATASFAAGSDYFKQIAKNQQQSATVGTKTEEDPSVNNADDDDNGAKVERSKHWKFTDPNAYAQKFIYWQLEQKKRNQSLKEKKLSELKIAIDNNKVELDVIKKRNDVITNTGYGNEPTDSKEDDAANLENGDNNVKHNLYEDESEFVTSQPRDWRRETRREQFPASDKFNKYRNAERDNESHFARKLKSEKYLEFKQSQQQAFGSSKRKSDKPNSYSESRQRTSRESNNEEKEQVEAVYDENLTANLVTSSSRSAELTPAMFDDDNDEIVEEDNDDDCVELTAEERLEKEIQNLRPSTRPLVYNLAFFANNNTVLQKFIQMGVSIREWDKDTAIGNFILKLDFDKHVKPYLIFLHDIGIPAKEHAQVITKNPLMFDTPIDTLRIRLDYLRSKKFTEQQIVEMIVRAPRLLNIIVEKLDTKLGWLQKEFHLNGNEVRAVMSAMPKLVILPLKVMHDNRFMLKDIMTYDDATIKSFMINYPRLFTKNFQTIEANFVFLTQVAKLTHEDVAACPHALTESLLLLKSRFSYLKHLDRLQFDPTKPNFVSLRAMISDDDYQFCKRVAKTTLDEYKTFLKTV